MMTENAMVICPAIKQRCVARVVTVVEGVGVPTTVAAAKPKAFRL
jgi:hypothetical protein